jgi:cytochrome c
MTRILGNYYPRIVGQTGRGGEMKALIRLAAVAAGISIALCAGVRAADNAGKDVFDRTCANCHSLDIGVNKIGPSLWHVIGRPVASLPGFAYSQSMLGVKNDWKNWDEKHLDLYLTNPREVLHGVKMYFKGLPDAKDRAAVIAYLGRLQ